MAGCAGEASGLPKQGESAGEVSREESRSARQRRLQLIQAKSAAAAGDCSCSCPKRVVNQGRRSGPNEVIPPCLSYGSVSIIGRRGTMEDAVTEAPGFASATVGGRAAYDFFGVYDEHSGASVAWACRDRLHVVLAEEVAALGGWPRTEEQWSRVMAASFSRVDGGLASVADRGEGSTALVAVVGAESIVVANCGDSRAVLSRGGMAVPLSFDHKADRPDEKERVEAAGGNVINWDVDRVSGVLATSRSIGDHYLKPFVIADPEVTVTKRAEEDELIILASDGLWDVVSNEMASRVARKSLGGQLPRKLLPERMRNQCNTAKAAAVILAELAYARGSRDNISVVVVEL